MRRLPVAIIAVFAVVALAILVTDHDSTGRSASEPRGVTTLNVNIGPTATATATPDPGLANIWVQSGGGTCAGGRSATRLAFASASSPDRICGDFDTACQAMSNGDLALVKSSTSFTAQTLSSSCNGASGSPKRICTAPGETVTITDNQAVLWNNSDYVIVCGFGWGPFTDSRYGTFRWEATSQNFAAGYQFQSGSTGSGVDGVEADANGYGGDADVTSCKPVGGASVCTLSWVYSPGGTTDITVARSDMCCNDDKGLYVDNNGTPANGWTIETSYLHDQVALTTSGGAHYECAFFNGTINTTFRRNVWDGCRSTGAINNPCSLCVAGTPMNITIENNLFLRTYVATSTTAHIGVDGCNPCNGYYRLRNNIFYTGLNLYATSATTDMTNNIVNGSGCPGGVTFTNNISTGQTCGTGDQLVADAFTNDAYFVNGANRFVNMAANVLTNWAPSATSTVIGAGNTSIFPTLDVLGCTRSSPPDIGPFKRGGC